MGIKSSTKEYITISKECGGVCASNIPFIYADTIQYLTAFYCLVAFWKMLGLVAERRMRVVLPSVTMLNGKGSPLHNR